MMFKRMIMLLGLVLALVVTIPGVGPVMAQTITDANDGTTLKQIIVFGRHSIRATTTDPSVLSQVAADSYPPFEVPEGYLTPNGRRAETLLGAYYRKYLLREGLLTGDTDTDVRRSYFRANSIQRSNITAGAFHAGLLPGATVSVHSYPLDQSDPVFDPILTNVAKVDPARAATEVQALFNSGTALASAYSGEYSLIRSALFDYPLGTQPPPDTPPGKVDPTAQEITLTANTTPPLYTGGIINRGGISMVDKATDPFVMQYADGFPLEQVAWGRLTLDQLSQQTRITNLGFEIEMRSPYLNRVQSSNAASHVLRSMEQAVIGDEIPGAFGDPRSRIIVVISSDAYVAGLAGMLQMHWQLPGYQPDFCAPGGALVFELRQSKTTKEYIVRAFYTAQTFDQLRNLTPLTFNKPPATSQLVIPGGSKSSTNLDVDFFVFQKLLKNAISPQYVQDPSEEVPPGVLHGVPLK